MLGLQLTLSFLICFLFWRLSNFFSLSHKLLQRLKYYTHLSEDQLAQKFSKIKLGKVAFKTDDPALTTLSKKEAGKIELIQKQIDPPTYLRNGTLTSLYHFSNYDNLVLLFSITICIFISSTIYLSFFSGRIEVNWGIIWIGIGLFHALTTLLQVMLSYSVKSPEFRLSVFLGLIFFIISLMILHFGDSSFLFKLDKSFDSLRETMIHFLPPNFNFRMTRFSFNLSISIFAGFFTSLLVFPSMRFTKSYVDSIAPKSNPTFIFKMISHASFLLPLFFCVSYISLFVQDFILPSKESQGLLVSKQLEVLRIIMLLLYSVFRFLSLRRHLQAHFNLAQENIQRLQVENGNITFNDYKKKITPIFYFACVVVIQLFTPPMIILYLSLSMMILGLNRVDFPQIIPLSNGFVFDNQFYHGILSFFCWWICFVQFTVSFLSLLYYRAFKEQLKQQITTTESEKTK